MRLVRGASTALLAAAVVFTSSQPLQSQETKGGPTPIAYTRNGKRVAVAGLKMKVALWEALDTQAKATSEFDTTPYGQVTALVFSPEADRLAAGTNRGIVVLWNVETSAVIHAVNLNRSAKVEALHFDYAGVKLTAYCGGNAYFLIDAKTGEFEEFSADEASGDVLATTGTTYAASSPTGEIDITDIATGRKLWALKDSGLASSTKSGSVITISPDGLTAAYQSGGQFYMATKGASTRHLTSMDGLDIKSIAFLPERALLAALRENGTVEVYDPASDKSLVSIPIERGRYDTIAASPDGSGVTISGPTDAKPVDLGIRAVVAVDADGNYRVPIYYATDRGPRTTEEKQWSTHFWAHFRTANGLLVAIPAVVLAVVVLVYLGAKGQLGLWSAIATVALALVVVFGPAAYYAWIRSLRVREHPGEYYGGLRGPLVWGSCEVSLPGNMTSTTELGPPSFWIFEASEDPKRDVLVRSQPVEEPRDDVLKKIAQAIAGSDAKEAFVYIHGYNTTYEYAVKTAAKMARDMKFRFVPVVFSWPSQGLELDYATDENESRAAVPDLVEVLQQLAEKSGAKRIHIVAHSMGNRVLTEALPRLESLDLQAFREVVLAAPDIDAQTFERDIGPSMKREGRRVTLYASSHDGALKLSKTVHGGKYARAGDSGSDVIVVDGIDTIDVSALNSDAGGHSYIVWDESVIGDVYYLLRGVAPRERFRLSERRTAGGKLYWSYQR